eukprot:m.443272 g.443272  ORF g.443272 m.443272 type:complete len:92 (-) comp21483_c0_seq7:1165-1440(-)
MCNHGFRLSPMVEPSAHSLHRTGRHDKWESQDKSDPYFGNVTETSESMLHQPVTSSGIREVDLLERSCCMLGLDGDVESEDFFIMGPFGSR